METTPLVEFTNTALCSECEAELTLHTDGITAYAVTPDETYEVRTLLRDGSKVTASCPITNRAWGGECGGVYEFDLATPGCWDKVGESYLKYGEKLELA